MQVGRSGSCDSNKKKNKDVRVGGDGEANCKKCSSPLVYSTQRRGARVVVTGARHEMGLGECGYLVGHSAEIFHLVTSHLVDDFLEPEDIGLFFFIGLTLSDGPHLDEDLVICQG